MRLRLLSIACALVAAAIVVPATASAAVTRVSCGALPKGASSKNVACLLVDVPSRHEVPNSPKYKVAVSVVRARKRSGKRPVLILGGGPGQSFAANGPSLASTRARTSVFGRLRANRDLILVDQRGAGNSTPLLDCQPELKGVQRGAGDAQFLAGATAAYAGCATRLRGAGIDLGTFTSSQIAQDTRTIVSALKRKRVDVIAVSHGTKVAMLAAARSDKWIGRMILSSVIQPGANFIADAPAAFNRALQATYGLCQRDRLCSFRYPDLATKLEQAITGLEAAPLTAPAAASKRERRPAFGRPFVFGAAPTGQAAQTGAPTTITASLAASALYQLYYSPRGYQAVPNLISRLAARDPALLSATAPAPEGDIEEGITTGQFFAVECAEDIATLDIAKQAQVAASLGAATRVFVSSNVQFGPSSKQVCQSFGVPPSLAKSADVKRIKRPTLVVNGALDQVTPPAYGTTVAKSLRNGRLVTFEAGHSPVTAVGKCGYDVMRRFLDGRRKLGTCS